MDNEQQEEILSFEIAGVNITASRARIIILQCYGVARKNIALILGVSIHTIDTQLDRIHKQLHVNNQAEVVAWGIENKLRKEGYVQGHYIFHGYTGLPWEPKQPPNGSADK